MKTARSRSAVEQLLGLTDSLEEAFEQLIGLIHGSYALAVIFAGRRDVIFAARNGSPLAIGYGEIGQDGGSEMFIGSDALALAPFTDRVSYLEDGDWAVVRADRVVIRNAAGDEVIREIETVPDSMASAEKGPFRHYMLKEIHDQPQTLARLLSSLVDTHESKLKPFLADLDFRAIDKVTLIACGTAHYACNVAKYWFEEIAGIATEIDIASEYRYRRRIHSKRQLIIAVSQSGETADTLAALKDVKDEVVGRLAIVNVPTSSLAREADYVLKIEAGPEIGVASTKAFTGQLLALLLLSLKAGSELGNLREERMSSLLRTLATLPRLIRQTIGLDRQIELLAHKLALARDAIFLGRGISYPIALEAALKLKEISYINATGYAAGELKHGPIALIDASLPVIVFDAVGNLQDKTLSNAAEVRARGGQIWHIGKSPTSDVVLPNCTDEVTPFPAAVAAQMLAYHAALTKGTDVDQPRNLAKSVTVE